MEPKHPLPRTATRSIREHDPLLNKVRGQILAFDLETRGNHVQWTDAPGTHVQLASFVINGGPAQLTTGGPALEIGPDHDLFDLLAVAGTLAGHGIMNYDLIVLAHQYPDLVPDPWVLATSKRLWDTQLVESLLDPPEARWKEGEAQRHYKLDEVIRRYGLGEGKTLDLAKVAKTHKGFENIPWSDPDKNVDLLRYARQDAQDVWSLYKDQLHRLICQPQERQVSIRAKVEYKPNHFRHEMQARTIPVPRLTLDYIEREHRVAALAAQIQLNGFRVNVDLLQARIEEGEQKKARILHDLQTQYGLPMVDAKGKPYKAPQSTKTGKQAIRAAFMDTGLDQDLLPLKEKSKDPDLSKETMQAIVDNGDNDQATAIAEAVLSLNGVRSIYAQVQDSLVGDRVHPNISFRQASGRWSFTKPGLTVVGKRGGRVIEREVFIAEEGHVILTADLSQVDARAVAAFAQDENYLELFGEGRDLWTEMSQRFGIDRDKVKVLGHGANYSMGVNGAARHNPNIPRADIERFYRERAEQFPKLAAWQERVRQLAGWGLYLDNGFGRLLRVDPERAYTQAPALSGQSAARDIMMEGLLRLADAHPETLPWLRAVIHDEGVWSVPEDRAKEVGGWVEEAFRFEWAPHWNRDLLQVQIKAEASIGQRDWASAYGK